MAARSPNRVRQAREALGMSQVALAAATQLSRQSIGAIEAGRTTPAVDVALRVARALERNVEDLFGAAPAEAPLLTEATGPATTPATTPESASATAPARSGRVAVAHVGGRWVSYPLDGAAFHGAAFHGATFGAAAFAGAADALVSAAGKGSRRTRGKRAAAALEVAPLRSPAELRENLVLMGCALGLGLLADRLNAKAGAGRFRWLPHSSTEALEALQRSQVHIAGVHLMDPKSGEPNLAEVRKHSGKEPLALIALARWEAGLVTAPHNPRGIRSAADLGQRGLRCVVREAGSGARRLLERELARAGLPRSLASAAPLHASGHLQVACAVAMGAADTGVATRDAALALGLHFVPLAEERYDLVLPPASVSDPRIERLLGVLCSAPFQRELSALGYDVRCSGDRVAELAAA